MVFIRGQSGRRHGTGNTCDMNGNTCWSRKPSKRWWHDLCDTYVQPTYQDVRCSFWSLIGGRVWVDDLSNNSSRHGTATSFVVDIILLCMEPGSADRTRARDWLCWCELLERLDPRLAFMLLYKFGWSIWISRYNALRLNRSQCSHRPEPIKMENWFLTSYLSLP